MSPGSLQVPMLPQEKSPADMALLVNVTMSIPGVRQGGESGQALVLADGDAAKGDARRT